MIVGAGKSSGQAGSLETQGRVDVADEDPKAVWRQSSFFLRGPQPVFSSSPLADWMRPAHVTEDNQLHSKSTYLNVNHIEK